MSDQKTTDLKNVSRRAFLKTAGSAAGAAAVAPVISTPDASGAERGKPPGPRSRGGILVYPAAGAAITLNVNGKKVATVVTPATTLLDALRENLGLTGSKEFCGRGACGACTVLLNGKAVTGCMIPAIDAVGAKITTIEGLGGPGGLDPIQKAFIKHDACQCGYCIPGFIVRSRALLNEKPNPSAEEIKEGLAGNICRCGTYAGILDAVQDAAKGGAL